MDNLEHKIKEVFVSQDSKTRLTGKDAMWNRIDNSLHKPKGVVAFWRVAAVFLGLLLTAGVFASINYRTKQQLETEKLQIKNARLAVSVDSLLAIPAQKVEIKTQIIEREKIVYRYRKSVINNSETESFWKEQYQNILDSNEVILANSEAFYAAEIERVENELAEVQQELDEFKQNSSRNPDDGNSKQIAPFKLNSERIEVGVDKEPVVKNPEVEMKILQKNFIENRNNLNKTIFNK